MEIVRNHIKEIISFVIGVLITSITFLLYNNHELKKEIITVEKPIVKVETKVETKTDTIYRTITKPQFLTQTIIRTDTIKQDSVLPIVQRDYITAINTDSVSGEIKAVVSGYNPQLDTLQYNLHIPTKTITNEITVESVRYKQKHWNWGVTAGFGYGITTKRPDLFIGLGVQYSF